MNTDHAMSVVAYAHMWFEKSGIAATRRAKFKGFLMLSISNLCMSYGKQSVLKNINLQIETGLFGLLGPNGAGKSTLMKIIATALPAQSGEIQFDGCEVLAQPQQLRQQLGYLPQEFGGYPGISAYKLLEHSAIIKGVTTKSQRKEQIDYLLHKGLCLLDDDVQVFPLVGEVLHFFLFYTYQGYSLYLFYLYRLK